MTILLYIFSQKLRLSHQIHIFSDLVCVENICSNKKLLFLMKKYSAHTVFEMRQHKIYLGQCLVTLTWLTGYEIRTSINKPNHSDFLIKLGIKPLMHILEISIFSLNKDLVRLNKIMNNLFKDLKILSFQVIFQCLKLVESFCLKYLM